MPNFGHGADGAGACAGAGAGVGAAGYPGGALEAVERLVDVERLRHEASVLVGKAGNEKLVLQQELLLGCGRGHDIDDEYRRFLVESHPMLTNAICDVNLALQAIPECHPEKEQQIIKSQRKCFRWLYRAMVVCNRANIATTLDVDKFDQRCEPYSLGGANAIIGLGISNLKPKYQRGFKEVHGAMRQFFSDQRSLLDVGKVREKKLGELEGVIHSWRHKKEKVAALRRCFDELNKALQEYAGHKESITQLKKSITQLQGACKGITTALRSCAEAMNAHGCRQQQRTVPALMQAAGVATSGGGNPAAATAAPAEAQVADEVNPPAQVAGYGNSAPAAVEGNPPVAAGANSAVTTAASAPVQAVVRTQDAGDGSSAPAADGDGNPAVNVVHAAATPLQAVRATVEGNPPVAADLMPTLHEVLQKPASGQLLSFTGTAGATPQACQALVNYINDRRANPNEFKKSCLFRCGIFGYSRTDKLTAAYYQLRKLQGLSNNEELTSKQQAALQQGELGRCLSS